jgi:hypothetical protein
MVLAGCQKPTPGVTLQSGKRVVRADATAYVRDGKQIRSDGAVKVLLAYPGSRVGIDVDGSIAEKNWSVHITSRGSGATTFDSPNLSGSYHYYFEVGSETTDVVVSQIGADGSPTGLWAFSVQPTLR